MTNITTTSWLIANLSDIASKKIQYQWLIAKYKEELEQSELSQKIKKWEEMLKEINLQEIELKNQWLDILDKAWIDKFEANWVEVRIKTSPWSLVVTDEDLIDDEYKSEVVKTTIKIDKNAIKKDLKEWVIVEWVLLKQEKTLEIKYK